MKLLIATTNKGKLREYQSLLKNLPLEIESLVKKSFIEPKETGFTFEENAKIKAREYAKQFQMHVLADDSGLEVDALNGAPGIYSARFAGENSTDETNIEKILNLLQDTPYDKRTARFVCAIAIAAPNGNILQTTIGHCSGIIDNVRKGKNGFGYDSVFTPKGFDKTLGELDFSVKETLSHRNRAILILRPFFKDYFV